VASIFAPVSSVDFPSGSKENPDRRDTPLLEYSGLVAACRRLGSVFDERRPEHT
jgi:hypothetical protein